MLDVLLLNPYVLSHHAHHISTYRPYPPLGLMSIAAVLRAAGYSVEIHDGTFQGGTGPLRERLTTGVQPRIVYMQAMSSFREVAVSAVERMKELGMTVVAGGPDPSIHDAQYLESGVDVVVRCQPEVVLPALLSVFGVRPSDRGRLPRKPSDEELLGIPGVSFLDEEVNPRRSSQRTQLPATELPMPAYDLVDIERYAAEWRRVHGFASLQLATDRTCPFSCIWCARDRALHAADPPEPVRAAERAVDEVAHVVTRYGIEHLSLTDAAFLSRRALVDAFAGALRARVPGVRWECRGQLESVDRALLEHMRAAGCERITFAIESGSPRVLAALRRPSGARDARRVARDMHALGIALGGHVLFGYPGEDWSDIEHTIALIRELAPIDYTTSVACPVPGTELYDFGRGVLHAPEHWVGEDPAPLEWDAPYSPTFYRAVDALLAAEYDLALERSLDRYARSKIFRALLGAMRLLGEGRGRVLRFEGFSREARRSDRSPPPHEAARPVEAFDPREART